MNVDQNPLPTTVLHWNYRGFTEFPTQRLNGEESDITDIYLKENLISRIPRDIVKLDHLESLYLSGNDITELPREISKLRCLKCLDVSGNRLRYIPDEIGEVGGLKFLILDENELRELPLRLVELRALRYLSVCDNILQWLPQQPVYNYHHCEFRFWRNSTLKTIPYSLWYHMFRDQQTRSLNIGCLNIPHTKYRHISNSNRCRLKINIDSSECILDVDCPPQHNTILENGMNSPPSLFETCKRVLYQMISDAAKSLNTDIHNTESYYEHKNNLTYLEENFGGVDINNENCDLNGNNITSSNIKYALMKNNNNIKKTRHKKFYVAADILDEYFNFLPNFIIQELSNGPISRCENVSCKKPIFDYVFYEFCLGKIILIENTEDVILSAAFCSKDCANAWTRSKTNLVSWELMRDS